MALIKTVVLFLALLSGVLYLQAVVADEVTVPTLIPHVVGSKNSTNVSFSEDVFSQDVDVIVDGEHPGVDHADSIAELLPDVDVDRVETEVEEGESAEFESLEDAGDKEEDADAVLSAANSSTEVDVDGEDEGEEEALSPAHPLARILTSRSSRRCWNAKTCKKFFQRPGCCKKKCVNLASSNKNCGKCGKCCNTKKRYHCSSGKCKKRSRHVRKSSCSKHKKCLKGHTCCKGQCVKLASNSENCGKCGKCCKSGQCCKSGKCVNSIPTPSQCGKDKKCVKGHTCCKNKCVNLGYNNGHCGKCDKGCDTEKGFSCKHGKCTKSLPSPLPGSSKCAHDQECVKGHTCCKNKCVNLSYNNGHCGRCDKGCDTKDGFSCNHGKCVKPSPPTPSTATECGDYKKCKNGHSCCKGKCVSLSTDNKNCGLCHKCCDTRKGFSCKSGKCVKKPTFSQCGYRKCTPGQTCCDNKCVSLSTDSSNCGVCSKACDHKKGYCCKSGQCVQLSPTSSECGLQKKCPSGHTCCKGRCVNLKSNNGHCGKCNNGCGYGSACCHGISKNIKHDDRNCGKCGKSCGFAKKCCHGYCVNVFGSDKNHCGACGKKCPTTCKSGMCGYGQ